ncbi:MAG: Crp/Fnr family transcriptional regulator [Sphingomonas sp.]|jgi:CRP-like cAMP-binding protein|uniref:Crp/Fnr family transcriptional regulator n=1 Tax=Sphingomonas sp. TaxID=28214 RepID=UPI0035616D07
MADRAAIAAGPGRTAAFFSKLRACACLSGDEERALQNAMRDVRFFSAGTHIVEKGDRPHYVHILLSGWAARYELLSDGSRSITAFLVPGDICDQHATAIGRMDHSILTLTPATVAYVPNGRLEAIARAYPRVAQALWWATLVDEAVLRAWLVNIGRRGAFEAIGHLLCELHVRLGTAGLTGNAHFELPITQNEIADAQGLTTVHVNRMLRRLRKEGYITLASGRLVINDVARLEAATGFDPGYLHNGPAGLLRIIG